VSCSDPQVKDVLFVFLLEGHRFLQPQLLQHGAFEFMCVIMMQM
jgi:hypothetical protein